MQLVSVVVWVRRGCLLKGGEGGRRTFFHAEKEFKGSIGFVAGWERYVLELASGVGDLAMISMLLQLHVRRRVQDYSRARLCHCPARRLTLATWLMKATEPRLSRGSLMSIHSPVQTADRYGLSRRIAGLFVRALLRYGEGRAGQKPDYQSQESMKEWAPPPGQEHDDSSTGKSLSIHERRTDGVQLAHVVEGFLYSKRGC